MEGSSMQKSVVILVGPPGSGKDTQAERLVAESGFVQVPSSKIIRAKFAANPDDSAIQREAEKFEKGKLNDPVLVASWVMEYVRPLAAKDVRKLVFSGSPRTPHEAEVEFPALQELYGRPNVVLVYLDVDLDVMTKRIAGRLFCRKSDHIFSADEAAHLKKCPYDGSKLYRRPLDSPELVQTRHEQFVNLTLPVVDIAKRFAVPVFTLDGNQAIEAVHHEVAAVVERRQSPVPAV